MIKYLNMPNSIESMTPTLEYSEESFEKVLPGLPDVLVMMLRDDYSWALPFNKEGFTDEAAKNEQPHFSKEQLEKARQHGEMIEKELARRGLVSRAP